MEKAGGLVTIKTGSKSSKNAAWSRPTSRSGWRQAMVCAILLAWPSCLFAQAPPMQRVRLGIDDIDVQLVRTPQFDLRSSQTIPLDRSEWGQVTVTYDLESPTWVDELTFDYYLLMKRDDVHVLLPGSVTYVNVPEAEDLRSMVYLHPTTLARFGEIDAVMVIVQERGVRVAEAAEPEPRMRWWEQAQVPRIDGLVLSRIETPFGVINAGELPAIRRGGR